MRTRRVDGRLFDRMLRNGLNCLAGQEKEINALNVFPVADGDTGTNMLMTLRNGIACAPDTVNLNEYLQGLSSGMLLGARGNSGVILSQLFRGIQLELSRRRSASALDLRNAFTRAYMVAYESVVHPAEGTILTVTREGIEKTSMQIRQYTDVETLLKTYLTFMEVSLSATPELLPILAEMNVVDSGAKGYIAIVQGMLDELEGVVYPSFPKTENLISNPKNSGGEQPDLSLFTEDSRLEKGYCLEFILQRLRETGYERHFEAAGFIRTLEQLGDSVALVEDGSRVKVHIHTREPAPILVQAQRYGEFLTFKLENMDLQHSEFLRNREEGPEACDDAEDPDESAEPETTESPELPSVPVIELEQPERIPEREAAVRTAVPRIQKTLSVIAVVNGEGNRRLFMDLGCSQVLEGGATMNTSAQELMEALQREYAEKIVLLPNHPNIFPAARQAVALSGMKNVEILETRTIPEGYCAMMMDLDGEEDAGLRLRKMRSGMENVVTLLVTAATKPFSQNEIHCDPGDWIVLRDGSMIVAAQEPVESIALAMLQTENIGDRETCIIFRGACGDTGLADEIGERIQELFPMLECIFLDGEQETYDWMIALI